MQRAALGVNDLAPVVIDHPLSTLTEAEIDRLTMQIVPRRPSGLGYVNV